MEYKSKWKSDREKEDEEAVSWINTIAIVVILFAVWALVVYRTLGTMKLPI